MCCQCPLTGEVSKNTGIVVTGIDIGLYLCLGSSILVRPGCAAAWPRRDQSGYGSSVGTFPKICKTDVVVVDRRLQRFNIVLP